MKRWYPRILPRDPLGWFLAILITGFIVASLGECVDWLDRRSCRVDGGHVEKIDDGSEWRCVRSGGAR